MSELFRFQNERCEGCGADRGENWAFLMDTGYDESPDLPDACRVTSYRLLCWRCLSRWMLEDCRESIYCGRSERAN